MKKNRMFDTKGFMLVETLLVSLTIAGILVYMYSQFSTINSSYQRLYNYNTTDTIYQIGAFKDFMVRYTKGNSIYSGLDAKVIGCHSLNLETQDDEYCNMLYDSIAPELIILTKGQYNTDTILSKVTNAENKAVIKKFLSTVEQGSSTSYRLIILYDDDRVATVQYKFN